MFEKSFPQASFPNSEEILMTLHFVGSWIIEVIAHKKFPGCSMAARAVGPTGVKLSCVSQEFPLEGTIDFPEAYVDACACS